MKKEILAVALCALALTFVGCGGNRYLKSYSGVSSYPSSDHCDLVQVEAQVYYSGYTMNDFLNAYKNAGYEMIGSSSKKQNVVMNARHKRKMEATCEKKGGNVALYDNGPRIIYLRQTSHLKRNPENIVAEDVPMSKAPFVWLGILGTLAIIAVAASNSK